MQTSSKVLVISSLLAACAGATSCSNGAENSKGEQDSQVNKIIGSDDRIAPGAGGVNIPQRYRPLMAAHGAIRLKDSTWVGGAGIPFCTATHIGNGLAVTAGHCFEEIITANTDADCSSVVVDWNYVQGEKVTRARCKKVLFAMNDAEGNGVDFAIFSVDAAPSVHIPLSKKKAPLGSKITMFGFPMSKSLVWSKTCTVLNTDEAAGLFSPIMMGHKCDTEPGNSGSSILDDKTLEIVAIHDGGLVMGDVALNYGTHIARVRELYPLP